MSDDNFGKGILTGALIGGLIGAAIGILLAPKSGEETRQELMESAKDFAGKVQDNYDEWYDKARRSTDNLVERLREVEAMARSKADEIASKMKST